MSINLRVKKAFGKMPEPLDGDARVHAEMSFEDVDIQTPAHKASSVGECDMSHLYDDYGNIIHLHQLPESLLKLRDHSMEDTTNGPLMDRSADDNASHDSSTSHSSMKVSISDPEPASSLAVLQSVQKLKQCVDPANRSNIFSPSRPVDSNDIEEFPKNGGGSNGNDHDDNDQSRDHYVRSAARFRSLLDDAFRKTIHGYANTVIMGDSDEPMEDLQDIRKKRKTRYSEPIHDTSRRARLSLMFRDVDADENQHPNKISNESVTATLLKEKVGEILLLQKSLKESQEHANGLSHANTTLREASATHSTRMERTTEALRIAGVNAANARADADAAIARASSLATQVSAMKSVLADTKRTCDTIREEHEAISTASKQLEIRYLQLEAELSKANREKERAIQDRAELSDSYEQLLSLKRTSDQALDQKNDEVRRLRKALMERDDVEKVRVDRTHRIETELRDARAQLAEAIFTSGESETTSALLNDTIKVLTNENKSLHEQIGTIVENAAKERGRVQDELRQSEQDVQKLRLKVVTHEEEIDRMLLDKTDSEKEISNLKRQIAELEKRLAGSSNAPVDDKALSAVNEKETSAKSSTGRLSLGLSLPPLRPLSTKAIAANSEKDNVLESDQHHGKRASLDAKASVCSICHKPTFGMMKMCQCGRPNCDKRAHAMCVVNINPLPSVSHPGTPAPMLPIVLCHGAKN